MDLVNVQHLQNYVKIARKIATSVEDYLGNDDLSQLYRSNDTTAGNVYPFKSTDAAKYDSTEGYIDNKYIHASNLVDQDLFRHRQFPLGAIPGTLFAVDRDYYSPVEQYLRITAGTGNKVAFATSDKTKPDTAPGLIPTITINQCYLYLAVEQNASLAKTIRDKAHAGQLAFRMPYTTSFRNVGSDKNTQTNIQIQISQQYGKRLKRILHTVWHPTESLNTAYDCSNWDGKKIESYQTFLDSIPLQDRILSCRRPSGASIGSDDWMENKKFVEKRSCILSKDMYALNWFHIDQFFEPHEKTLAVDEVNLDEGLLMDTSKAWTFSGKTGDLADSPNKAVHYTFVEFAREVLIGPLGPQFL